MPLTFLLALYWFVLMGALGIFFPFYSLFLSETLGLSGTQTGIVMGTMPLVGMIVQPVWGQIADITGSRTRVATVLALGSAAGFAALMLADDFVTVLIGTALTALFLVALVPTGVSVSMALLGEQASQRFGYVRVWGTIGYLVSVVAFPWTLKHYQHSGVGLELMLPVTAFLYILTAGLTAMLPSSGSVSARAQRGDWLLLVRHPPFVRFLCLLFLVYVSQQGPMGLFPLLVAELGGGADMVGDLWVFMVALEIPLVPLSGYALSKLGARGLLFAGVFSGGLRWLITGLATDLNWLYAAQLLHGITVTGIMIGAALYVELVVPERLRSTGQSMVSMIGVSLGGLVSNVAAGRLIDSYGARSPAVIGGILGLALALALPFVLSRTRPLEEPE